MEELLGAIAFLGGIAVSALAWWIYRLRVRLSNHEARLASLTRRVYELENGDLRSAEPPPLETLPQPHPEPPVSPAPPAIPTKTEDWETVIGGNWLNRAGALILVIGIALFLGYSLTQLGAAGKVGIGFAVGAAMLGAGIALRNHELYGSFALSLIGGGWAAIYFTAYAAHALEPARVIGDPLLAGVLLFAVSTGMILHALAYASEHGTALAFLFSFITLNISPLTGFSIYAALVLALSMLALAYLRQWFRLAVVGVLFAYGTFILRRDAAEPLAQWALWIQWFAFEAFDILDLHRRGPSRGIERSVFLLNAAGFIGASLLYQWEHLGWFLFFSSAAYLVSTAIRARVAAGPEDATSRLLGGGYEGALTASAALMAGALMERFSGTNMTLALLFEGEMIVLAGHALNNAFIRAVGAAVLSLAFFRAAVVDYFSVDRRAWSPVAAIVAAVFAANRWKGGWAYAAGAGILIAMLVNAEAPREWVPAILAGFGLIALALAVTRNHNDIRLQHLPWAVGLFFIGWIALDYGPPAMVSVALTVASFYASQFLTRQRRYAPNLYSALGTLLLTL
ncbi:MAG TPA: DUF2339 domain-containing protein, partial [Bryobacteraceae bacterium]|nr:DUF2339 domain-containing protein [Bryobacteraceae bacterium]